MKSMCKHWGLHISTNINCLSAVLNSFWAVWRGLLWCLKAKLRSWRFPRYWWFNKQYHSGYQLICLISQPLLIDLRRDWYRSKGLLKGFKLALRPWESSKNWWRYGRMKFVTPRKQPRSWVRLPPKGLFQVFMRRSPTLSFSSLLCPPWCACWSINRIVVLIVSVHMTSAHGPSVLVYKTACVVRFSFT